MDSEAERKRRGTLGKRRADEKMTAAPAERPRSHQTEGGGTFESRQDGEEGTGVCEVCEEGESSGSRSASAARVEPECFYFLRQAAGERHCEAAEFPPPTPTVGNGPHALDCFSPDKSGDERRKIAAPLLAAGPTYAARMSERRRGVEPQ